MENCFTIKKGFTLLELIAVVVIVGVLLLTIISNGTNFMNRAKCQATIREMNSIAQAAIDFYNSSNNPNDTKNPQALTWPADPTMLANNVDPNNNNMPQVVTKNPFGNAYQISSGNSMVTVSTIIPNGILIDPTEGSFLNITSLPAGKQISITQSIPNEYSGRLTYDLNYYGKE